jgi:uncharacterized delta-60 repeat protein
MQRLAFTRILCAVTFGAAAAHATTTGGLDPSFNGSGIVTTTLGPGDESIAAIAVGDDGKIAAAGTLSGTSPDIAVARYNPDGTLDTTFNGTGTLLRDVSASDYAAGIALLPDGKTLVAGSVTGTNNYDFALFRFNRNGTPDNSFNGNGTAVFPFDATNAFATAMTVDPDGPIIVAGDAGVGANPTQICVARYTASGTLDTTFAGTGFALASVGSVNANTRAVALQDGGKIVVAGFASNGANNDFLVARFNANGSLDTTFNGTGFRIQPIGANDDEAAAVAVQSDGKIVVAGFTVGATYDYAMIRLNENGSLDDSFGGDGIVTTALGSLTDIGRALALRADDRIVVAGNAFSGSNKIGLAFYRADGSPDTAFNGTGIVTAAFPGANVAAFAVAVQPDGKIVAAGGAESGAGEDFALARFNVRTVDARISKSGTTNVVGDDLYDATGSSQKAKATFSNKKTYTVTVQNESGEPAAFTLEGSRSSGGFKVKYFDANETDVTAAVTSGSYQTPVLAPGVTETLTLEVKRKSSTAPGTSKNFKVTARSPDPQDGSFDDAVKAKATAK